MRDPSTVEAKLVALVRELSRRAGRPATEEEVRAALAPLSAAEEADLREHARGEPSARPLGPMAWADIARGTTPETAAARELTGYYEVQAERDALAQVLRAKDSDDERPARAARRARDAEEEPAPGEVALEHRPIARKPLPARDAKARALATDEEQASRLLTLFAYHRDTPLVAKALGWSLSDLDAEIDRLHLRRKAGKLLRGLDTELPVATVRGARSSEPVRRRSAQEKADTAARDAQSKALAALAATEDARQEKEELASAKTTSKRIPGRSLKGSAPAVSSVASKRAAAALALEAPAAPEKRERLPVKPSAEQGTELRAILREVGPRRHALAARLGAAGKPLSPAALLARFRAAGLEREFGQRERDLIRALVSRHRCALAPAAAELGVHKHELEQLIRERGLAREVEEQREQKRTQARATRWPKARVALLLERRDWLQDLGLADELEADVRARVKLVWSDLPAGDQRLDALAKALGIPAADAQLLADRLSLR